MGSELVGTAMATHDPERGLSAMPDGALHGNQAQRYYAAMRTLAETDIDKALGYFDGIRSMQARRMIGNMIGTAMARQDPARALEWARAEDGGGQPALTMSVLTQLANTDPALALAEASKLDNRQWRRQSVSTVLSTVARTDPASAIAYLNEINDRQDRDMAMASIVGQWAGSDPEAAVDWLLSGDVPDGERFLVQVGHRLVSNDVDTAIRLLPRVDEQTSMQWRQQITLVLATQRSPAEAARFVQQFAGDAGYDALRSTLISGVSQQDIGMARRLVRQLPAGELRDRGYAQVIAQHSHGYPAEAASWLDSIADETVRSQTAAQVIRQWYGLEPQAASQWIEMQPAGTLRDNVIRHIAGSNSDSPREIARLIDSMSDPDLRRQALTAQVYAIARTNPDAARLMLGRLDMPDEERRQVERQLENMRLRATQYGLTY